jgi:hypothetical protein
MLVIGKNSLLYEKIRGRLDTHSSVSHTEVPLVVNEDVLLLSFPRHESEFADYMKFLEDLSFKVGDKFKKIFVSTAGLNGIPAHLVRRYSYLHMKRKCELFLMQKGWVIVRMGSLADELNLSGDWLLADLSFFELRSKWGEEQIQYAVKLVRCEKQPSWMARILNNLYAYVAFCPFLSWLALLIHALNFNEKNRGYTYLSNTVGTAKVSIGAGLSTTFSPAVFLFHVVPPPLDVDEILNQPPLISRSKKINGFGDRWHGVRRDDTPSESVRVFGQNAELIWLRNPPLVVSSFVLRLRNRFRRFVKLDVRKILPADEGLLLVGDKDAVYVSRATLNAGAYETAAILTRSQFAVPGFSVASQYTVSFGPLDAKSLLQAQQFMKKIAWKLNTGNDEHLIMLRPPLPMLVLNAIVFGSFRRRIITFFKNFDVRLLKWLLYSKLSLRFFDPSEATLDVQYLVCQTIKHVSGKLEISKLTSDADQKVEKLLRNFQEEFGPDVCLQRGPFDALHVTIPTPLSHLTSGLETALRERLSVGPVHRLFGLCTSEHTSHLLLDYEEITLFQLPTTI